MDARLQQDVVGQTDLADVVQGDAAGEEFDEVRVDQPGEPGLLGRRFRQAAAVTLHSEQMRPVPALAVAHQFGERPHEAIAGLDHVAVAGGERPLQFVVDLEETTVQRVGTVLGVLEAQCRPGL